MDKVLHVVICMGDSGLYCVERDLSDMGYAETVNDIVAGEWEGVAHVIEFNPIERTSRDVTEDIAWAVSARWAETDEELTDAQREFIECHLGFTAANAFRRAA